MPGLLSPERCADARQASGERQDSLSQRPWTRALDVSERTEDWPVLEEGAIDGLGD